jgi:hypothetical protein
VTLDVQLTLGASNGGVGVVGDDEAASGEHVAFAEVTDCNSLDVHDKSLHENLVTSRPVSLCGIPRGIARRLSDMKENECDDCVKNLHHPSS